MAIGVEARGVWLFILILAFWANVAAGSEYQQSQSAPRSASVACGEYARKANAHMREIVRAVDQVWDAHVRVYESVAMAPPHARPGGCVFYNAAYLNALLQDLLIRDRAAAESMLYAIMAHEVGHELHHDFSPQRANLSSATKELQADRFAGYTMERLNIGLDNITPYYSLAGDEFTGQVGRPASHGESMQRTDALKKGWDQAEWNQPEDYQPLSEGD
jgi:predicted metalloprotease